MLPVEWNVARLGEVVARSCRDHAEGGRTIGTHDPVDRFVDATVAAGNDDLIRPGIDRITDQFFEMADSGAGVNTAIQVCFGKNLPYPFKPTRASTATGRRVNK